MATDRLSGRSSARRAGRCLLLTVVAGATLAPMEQLTAQAGRRTVRGIVYDSVGRAALAGAVVQLMQLGRDVDHAVRRVATSDSAGQYAIDDVPEGAFAIGFFHPKLDSLGIEAPVVRRDGGRGGPLDIDLAVPSPATIVGASCGPLAARDSTGLVAGYVVAAGSARPRDDASVRAQWQELVIDRRGMRAATRELTAIAGDDGRFGFCGVPPGSVVVLRATAGADTGSAVELEVPENGILLRPLYLAEGSPGRVRGDGSAAPVGALPTVDAGPAALSRLSGTVRSSFGESLVRARVRIAGGARETMTDDAGEFALAGLSPGSQTLEVQAIGYAPEHLAIDLVPGQSARAALTMSAFPTTVDTVRIFARRPRLPSTPAGFESRRRLGFGIFLDAEEIERRAPTEFSDLLRSIPGIRVEQSGGPDATIAMQGNGHSSLCEPLLVIDGMHIPLDGMNINSLVPAHVIRAVEVYPRRLEAPAEFQTLTCGTIVVWTGARGWLAKRGKEARAHKEARPEKKP